MKKIFLIGCLLLTAACSSVGGQTPTPRTESTPSPVLPTRTPTEAATATLTPSPAPSLTPTPSPRYFTDEFELVPPAWAILQSSGAEAPVVDNPNGILTLFLTEPYSWVYVMYGAHEYTNVYIEASAASSESEPVSLGLVCRYSEANGWYEFNVSEDGTYNVLFGQWLADGVAAYQPIAADVSEYIHTDGGQNQVGLDCQENTLWLYLNGKLFRKLDVSRFGLAEGKVGLAAASFENTPAAAGFDWVKVGQTGQ
ncbi:MAG: hypothetical protein ACOY0R_14280 [Chloroflexota bacterium]